MDSPYNLLTAGLSMFAKDSVIQLLLGILICFAHFGYMTKKQPFVDSLDDILSQCAGIQIFLTLQIGLVLKVGQSNDQGIVDVVLVGLTLVVLGFGDQQKVLGVGDQLAPGIRVERIDEQGVVIDNQGRRERLRWPEQSPVNGVRSLDG